MPDDPQRPATLVREARTHNLKGVSCRFPHGALTVVTGVSGSGKSSLAFETVHQEGQRRYLQTFSTYARQYLDRVRRPPVEAIHHIQPTLALRQWNGVSQPRSTVGTVTELSELLGLLFSAIGDMACVACGAPVTEETPESIARRLVERHPGERVVLVAPAALPNDEQDANATIDGLIREGLNRLYVGGEVWRMEGRAHREVRALGELPLLVDRLVVPDDTPERLARLRDSVEQGLRLGRGELRVVLYDAGEQHTYYRDRRCNACGRSHPPMTAGLFSFNTPLGACPACNGFGRAMGLALEAIVPDPARSLAGGAIEPFQSERGRNHQLALEQLCRRHDLPIDVRWSTLDRAQRRLVMDGDEAWGGVRAFFKALERDRYKAEAGVLLAKYRRYTTCETCDGTRLSAEARAVTLRGHHVGELARLPVAELRAWFEGLDLDGDETARAGILPQEIGHRLRVLAEVGLGYLTLDRQTRTLSSGEYQRINLAACIGRALVDTCYVLDEPTAGLHARDSGRLLASLRELRDLGNTLIVVEHEPEVIRGADHLVELGPGGGEEGGELLYEGTLEGLRATDTPTARMLFGEPEAAPSSRAPGQFLTVVGAQAHNLQDLTCRLPLGRITAITGVSGSGKSTLAFEVLQPTVEEVMRGEAIPRRRCADLLGPVNFGAVIAMNQGMSGLTSRSTVMSYTGALEPIRKCLADTAAAREHGLTPFHFSTNVKGGRCETCEGMGVQIVDLHFMSDVTIICEACDGQRFKPNVLAVRFRGASIADVYEMTVHHALEHFSGEEAVTRHLLPLVEVGLGYLKLGQPTQTLSGGELQRLRIAEHLVKRRRENDERLTLFLFDEPSLGLHGQDVARLIALFRRLRGDGHTVVLVEHNLDLIAAADWVVDLGPEAGPEGGRLVVEGPPESVAAHAESHTGRSLLVSGRLKPPAPEAD